MLVNRYVPTHLHQMLFELVKNSLRAVQERFMDDDNECPPIRVVVADGIEDVTIKVLQFSFYDCLDLVTIFMSTCSLAI
jgi:pyruvate dehydrogenase kinase 2/3/4